MARHGTARHGTTGAPPGGGYASNLEEAPDEYPAGLLGLELGGGFASLALALSSPSTPLAAPRAGGCVCLETNGHKRTTYTNKCAYKTRLKKNRSSKEKINFKVLEIKINVSKN